MGSMKGKLVLAALCCTFGLAAIPASASATIEIYGGFPICGENCHIRSPTVTNWRENIGEASVSGQIACQLRSTGGEINVVEHGNARCSVFYGGGRAVEARVYNQTGVTATVTGAVQT